MKLPWNGPQAHLSSTGNPGDRPVCGRREGRAISSTLPEKEFYAVRASDRCKKCEIIDGQIKSRIKRAIAESARDLDNALCIHCSRPEGDHSGPPHQHKIFIPGKRCPAANLTFPQFDDPEFSRKAELYWTERQTQYEVNK